MRPECWICSKKHRAIKLGLITNGNVHPIWYASVPTAVDAPEVYHDHLHFSPLNLGLTRVLDRTYAGHFTVHRDIIGAHRISNLTDYEWIRRNEIRIRVKRRDARNLFW